MKRQASPHKNGDWNKNKNTFARAAGASQAARIASIHALEMRIGVTRRALAKLAPHPQQGLSLGTINVQFMASVSLGISPQFNNTAWRAAMAAFWRDLPRRLRLERMLAIYERQLGMLLNQPLLAFHLAA